MTWEKLKEILEKDFAVTILGTLYLMVRIVDRFAEEGLDDIKFYKLRTKNYHARLIVDRPYGSSLLLIKPKGFFKEWKAINQEDLPKFLADEIFSDACTDSKRKKLVSKVLELKAFW